MPIIRKRTLPRIQVKRKRQTCFQAKQVYCPEYAFVKSGGAERMNQDKKWGTGRC